MDNGSQKIEDAAELAQVQSQAHLVNLKSLTLAVALAYLSYVLPS